MDFVIFNLLIDIYDVNFNLLIDFWIENIPNQLKMYHWRHCLIGTQFRRLKSNLTGMDIQIQMAWNSDGLEFKWLGIQMARNSYGLESESSTIWFIGSKSPKLSLMVTQIQEMREGGTVGQRTNIYAIWFSLRKFFINFILKVFFFKSLLYSLPMRTWIFD